MERDDEKSRINKIKHGIDFDVARELWAETQLYDQKENS